MGQIPEGLGRKDETWGSSRAGREVPSWPDGEKSQDVKTRALALCTECSRS